MAALFSEESHGAGEGGAGGGEEPVSFQAEISSMLHGFGDNPAPHPHTVRLLEGAVRDEVRRLLLHAARAAERRQARQVSNLDVIYLLRRDKHKLKRLYDYQMKVEMVREKSKLLASTDNSVPDVLLEDDLEPSSKRRRTHTEVINSLDVVGEVQLVNVDAAKSIRNLRASKMTEAMSLSKYEAYHKARCVSFRSCFPGFPKSTQKFKDWINPNNEITVSNAAIDVLCHLAFETVAELVDIVFLIRQDAKKRSDDPFVKYSAGNFCNPFSLNNAVYIKSGYEGVTPITVAEVREAIRRIHAKRTGISGLFYRSMNNELPSKFIAC